MSTSFASQVHCKNKQNSVKAADSATLDIAIGWLEATMEGSSEDDPMMIGSSACAKKLLSMFYVTSGVRESFLSSQHVSIKGSELGMRIDLSRHRCCWQLPAVRQRQIRRPISFRSPIASERVALINDWSHGSGCFIGWFCLIWQTEITKTLAI